MAFPEGVDPQRQSWIVQVLHDEGIADRCSTPHIDFLRVQVTKPVTFEEQIGRTGHPATTRRRAQPRQVRRSKSAPTRFPRGGEPG